MPLMHVLLSPNAFDDAGKARLVHGLTEAACRAESVPDVPAARMRALVMIEELPSDGFYSAGKPAEALVCGVFLTWKVSAGVLDGARKEAFAKEIQAVAEEAARADGRLIVTSAVIEEVPEGQWAQSGQIRRLPDVAAIAQLQHLASIAERRDRKDAA